MWPKASERAAAGFTFVEAVLALLLTTLFLGGIMQFHSNALRTLRDMQDKEARLQILDAAAQALLADHELLEEETLTLEFLPEAPEVSIILEDEEELGEGFAPPGAPKLKRLRIEYQGVFLETSVLRDE